MRTTLREVTSADLPLMLAWAHIKEVWKYLPTARHGENLTWENHWRWWNSREQRKDWMIEVDSDDYGFRPVGVVIGNLKSGEIGLYIGETTLWGHGIGLEALKRGVVQMGNLGFERIWAVVHPKNKRSQRLFIRAGFTKKGKGRRRQDLYDIDLRTVVRLKDTD